MKKYKKNEIYVMIKAIMKEYSLRKIAKPNVRIVTANDIFQFCVTLVIVIGPLRSTVAETNFNPST